MRDDDDDDDDDDEDDDDDDEEKKAATKFCHGINHLNQANSGVRGSRSLDEAICTYIYLHTFQ